MVLKHKTYSALIALSLMVPVAAYAAEKADKAHAEAGVPAAPDEEVDVKASEGAEAAPAEIAVVTATTTTEGEEHNEAAAGEHELARQKWSFDGPFGAYDRASLQRGFQVYKEVCSACHSMNLVSYRNLADLGYSDAEVKAIAADVQITDGPNDEGEMFERAGRPSDHFKAPYANVQAAKYANGGAYPPDFSLIVKAREGGADYVYGVLTGYTEPPAGKELLDGQHWNTAMHGNIIAMPPPLTDGRVAYGDNSPQTIDQYAHDVASFLAWASEPHMEDRKRTGVKVFLFLLALTGVLYGVKRKIWANAH